MSYPVIEKRTWPPGGESYHFTCPACGFGHSFQTKGAGPHWTFNGDMVRPTFSPSLLAQWDEGEEHTPKRCHSFVRDGQIQFLSDCTHALAGQTVPLEPVELREGAE